MKTTFTVLAMAVLVVAGKASDAEPRPTCKAMCQRLTDCKMPSYFQRCLDNCKPHEASEEGRAQILVFTRYTCDQIRSSVPGANGHQPSSTQSGSVHSGDNCAPVCNRFDQCRLWKYDSCMGYCSSNTVDPAKNLSAAQWSCPKLGSWMQQLGVTGSSSKGDARSSGGVTCTAEASLGTTQGNMPTIHRTITAMGNGPSRGAASVKALKDCGALVGNALSLAWLSGEQTEGGNCAISRCTQ